MHGELVRAFAVDGVRLDGMVLSPTGEKCQIADAILCLHGVGSNFYSSNLFEGLTPTLLDLGLTVLWANTRGHDTAFNSYTAKTTRVIGAAFEIVDECRLDIAAWLTFLGRRNHERVILAGHSLGAIKSLYVAAYAPSSAITGVIAMSPPRLSYSAFLNVGEPSFREAIEIAKSHISAGQEQALIPVRFPFPMLITAASYLDKYGPEERYNIERFVNQLCCPALITYGQIELDSGGIAFAGLNETLPSLARPNQKLDAISIPDADHLYLSQYPAVAAKVREWLLDQSRSDA